MKVPIPKFHREQHGALQLSLGAQCCQRHGYRSMSRHVVCQADPHSVQEYRAGRGQDATDHDQFGINHVNQVGDPTSDVPAGSAEHLGAFAVALTGEPSHGRGVERRRGKSGASAQLPNLAHDCGCRCDSLQTAVLTAHAGRSVVDDAAVPYLAARSCAPDEHSSVDHDAGADPTAEVDANESVNIHPGAHFGLSEQRDIGVVAYDGLQPQRILHRRSQPEVAPLQVTGAADAIGVHAAGNGDPHSLKSIEGNGGRLERGCGQSAHLAHAAFRHSGQGGTRANRKQTSSTVGDSDCGPGHAELDSQVGDRVFVEGEESRAPASSGGRVAETHLGDTTLAEELLNDGADGGLRHLAPFGQLSARERTTFTEHAQQTVTVDLTHPARVHLSVHPHSLPCNVNWEPPMCQPPRPRKLFIVGALLSLLSQAGCSTQGLQFRLSDKLSIRTPVAGSRVELPLTITWHAKGLPPGAHFVVFLDRPPQPPGKQLSWLDRHLPLELRGHLSGVFETAEPHFTLSEVTRRTTGPSTDRNRHEITVIVVDAQTRRLGEIAAYTDFVVRGERS